MLRRVVVPVIVLIASLVACGRQVTPSVGTANGLLSGMMRVRFDTAAPMNFNLYRYAIVFNTNGDGQEPFANYYLTSLLNYSFVWFVGSANGFNVTPSLQQFFPITNAIGSAYVSVPPSTVQLTLNSNGQQNEFTLDFQRNLFYTLPPNASPTPSSTSGTSPTPQPTISGQNIWNINVFTIDKNNNILDAGGLGVNDTSFSLQVDTTQYVDNTLPFKKTGAQNLPPDPASQIIGGEIINSP